MAGSREEGGAASPATLRRLMKEYQAAQKEQQQQQQQQHKADTGSSRAPEAKADENLLLLCPRGTDDDTQLLDWQATIRGPPGGGYEGGTFDISIRVPASYPTKPPSMRFTTRLWHPNVSWKTGEICLDVLSSQWSPAWTLSSALTAVIALLDAPEPDSPLNVDAGMLINDCAISFCICLATVFRTGDRSAYKSMCRMQTLLHAAK